jgi:hypothetical protein
MDHDFLKGGNRERPFTPPPEQPILRWLFALLTVLALIYAGYRFIEWWNHRPPTTAIRQVPITAPNKATEQPSGRAPQTSAPPTLDPDNRAVTKCVINGKTSYGDGNCATGGVATQVTTKANHNLMAAVRPQTPVRIEEPVSQPAIVPRSESTNPAAETKLRCEALEARIVSLDAMGRQPQTLQTYDWIRDERKKTRDEQFRTPCK